MLVSQSSPSAYWVDVSAARGLGALAAQLLCNWLILCGKEICNAALMTPVSHLLALNLRSLIPGHLSRQIFDIIAACTYLAAALEPWIAVVVFITLISYIPLTVALTEWRGKFRRSARTLSSAYRPSPYS